jgi:hypothetical protein
VNARSTAIQGALAAVGLLAAYLTWQRGPELEQGETYVLDVTKTDVEKVRFEDEGSWVELTKAKDDNGDFVYVRLSGSDPGDVQLPSGHPMVQMKWPERLVRGSEAALKLFERFAPLRASRSLGQLDANLVKDLGLDKTKKKLEVTVRGVKRRFAVAPAPPGGTDPYLRAEDDGRAWVVARLILSEFEAAKTNLVERKLHGFSLQDFDKLIITGNGKSKPFLAKRVEGRYGVQLSPEATPDKPDTTAENWHERIFNLFPAEVLGQGEKPDKVEPIVALKLEYQSRGRKLGWLELARGGAAATSGGAGSADLFARSEFTAGWMKLRPEAATLLTDGENLAGK